MSMDSDKWPVWEKRLRDSLLFVFGLAGTINELWLEEDPRASALVFVASLLGLPFVFAKNDKERDRNGT